MPRRRTESRASGSAVVSQYQRRGGGGLSATSSGSALQHLPVTVAPGDWIPDDALYPNAPIPEWGTNGMIAYADLVHGLGTMHAVAVAWRDDDGWTYAQQAFIAQMPTPGSESTKLRIWLDPTPTAPITVYIAAFA